MPTAPRIYVDSADRDVVVELLRARLVHGVTTNPTILERDGARVADIPALYAQWVEAGAAEVFFQTWGATAAQLLANAEGIRALGIPSRSRSPRPVTGSPRPGPSPTTVRSCW